MNRSHGAERGDRTAVPDRSTRRMRRWVVLAVMTLAVGLASAAVAAAPFSSSPPAVEAAVPPPGVQPAVQKWLKAREESQIELNNALVPFVQKTVGKPDAAPAACHRLAKATRVLLSMAAAPHPKVDELTRAGLAKFERGATACAAGDLATAEGLVAEGLAERTAAQEPLDETLDGD
ncbi:MAG: hypothetical protein JWP61_831 [Friedmanniella sp.]|nr:hypothetical protein [Friedmanniella sp.]